MDHPDDDLEAYALGLLDAERGAAIDAHVAACDACARRLGEAEATVAALVEGEYAAEPPERSPRARPARTVARALGLAATFALVAGGLGALDLQLSTALRDDGTLVRNMVASHFVHAQFHSPSGTELEAKVVYERHGRWYEVLATEIDASYRIAVISPAGSSVVRAERFAKRGDSYALALPSLGEVRGLELRDGTDRTVGSVSVPKSGGR